MLTLVLILFGLSIVAIVIGQHLGYLVTRKRWIRTYGKSPYNWRILLGPRAYTRWLKGETRRVDV
jgi:hypothetical protein